MLEAGEDDPDAFRLVQGVLDLGYRRLLVAVGGARSSLPDGDDPRLQQSEITVLSDSPDGEAVPATDWILDRVDFTAKARSADFAVVCTDRHETAEAVLSRLADLGRACCLVSGTVSDPGETMRGFSTLRGVVGRPDAEASAEETFREAVLPLIGNGVAKTEEP